MKIGAVAQFRCMAWLFGCVVREWHEQLSMTSSLHQNCLTGSPGCDSFCLPGSSGIFDEQRTRRPQQFFGESKIEPYFVPGSTFNRSNITADLSCSGRAQTGYASARQRDLAGHQQMSDFQQQCDSIPPQTRNRTQTKVRAPLCQITTAITGLGGLGFHENWGGCPIPVHGLVIWLCCA